MIEIVFSDSFCGFLKLSQIDGEEIGEIVSLPLELDLGTLNKGALSEYRRKQITSWFFDDPWLGKSLYYPPDYESIKMTIDELRKRILKGEKARIWYDHCAYSVCCFYYLISILPQTELNLSVICLQEHPLLSLQHKGLETIDKLHSVHDLLSIERHLPLAERIEISNKWNGIAKTDYPLRVYLNGTLIGVPEDFYDGIIASCIPNEKDFRVTDIEEKVLSSEVIPHYDIALWRISAVLHQGKFNYETVVDLPLPLRGFLFHNTEAEH